MNQYRVLGDVSNTGRGTSFRVASEARVKKQRLRPALAVPASIAFSHRRRYEQWRPQVIRDIRASIWIDAAGGLRRRFTLPLSREFHATRPEVSRPVGVVAHNPGLTGTTGGEPQPWCRAPADV